MIALHALTIDTRHLTESDTADVRWSRSCAPDSNLRRDSHQKEGKSFIYDSVEASDLCQSMFFHGRADKIPTSCRFMASHSTHTGMTPTLDLIPSSFHYSVSLGHP